MLTFTMHSEGIDPETLIFRNKVIAVFNKIFDIIHCVTRYQFGLRSTFLQKLVI